LDDVVCTTRNHRPRRSGHISLVPDHRRFSCVPQRDTPENRLYHTRNDKAIPENPSGSSDSAEVSVKACGRWIYGV
jgi:hypothetical protein